MLNLKTGLDTAQAAARKAGEYILSNIGKIEKVEFKGKRNIVTEVDKESEQIIKTHLKKNFPDFQILGEELGGDITSEYYWLVDPLDGSNNFFHGYPVFCVSIGLMRQKKPLVGVVYDPVRDELFYASVERGAYLNKNRIKVSKIRQFNNALLATGFYYEFEKQKDTNIEHFVNFLYHVQGIRRSGSASIDLCYVACGRLDGFWELGLKPWDTSAGWLIVKEAGGIVTKFNDSEFDPFYPEIVASNSLIHKDMIKILNLK